MSAGVVRCGPGEVSVGVVLTVPEPWGSQLVAARGSFGDPLACSVPAHITIVGPTCVPRDQLEAVDRHVGAGVAEAAPFEVRLRGTGTFRPVSPVVFVAVAEGISSCERLHHRLLSGPLAALPPFPYHPHVTVAQEVEPPALDRAFDELAGFEARFRADSLGLYVQGEDGCWTKRADFPLAGLP